MTGQDEEQLQVLPAPSISRTMQYSAAEHAPEDPSIINVGGYESLRETAVGEGLRLRRDARGLRELDDLIDSQPSLLAGLLTEIGMFYGDVLTHTIPGAHWIVRQEPEVRVAKDVTVLVAEVARRRFELSTPTLTENFRHVLDLTTPR